MISNTGSHSRWLFQFTTYISVKIWSNWVFFVWIGWVLLSQTDVIECRNMVLTAFLNEILLGHYWRRNLRFDLLAFLLFIEDIRNFWHRLSICHVIFRWLIDFLIAWFIVRWLSRFLSKCLVIRLEWILQHRLWYLLPYRHLVSCLLSLNSENLAKLLLVLGLC